MLTERRRAGRAELFMAVLTRTHSAEVNQSPHALPWDHPKGRGWIEDVYWALFNTREFDCEKNCWRSSLALQN
jgi:hypothetical protein